jgi:hypothetical protein
MVKVKIFYLTLAATILATTSVFAMDPRTIGEELGWTKNSQGVWQAPEDFSLPLMSLPVIKTKEDLEKVLQPHHPGTMYKSIRIETSSREMDQVAVPFAKVFNTYPYLEELQMSRRTMGTFPIGKERMDDLASALKTSGINLKKLQISDSAVDDEGAEKLADYLKTNPPLRELNLWANEITDKGAIALGEAFKFNTNLRMFSLMLNKKITLDGIRGLETAVRDAGRTPNSPLTVDIAGIPLRKAVIEKPFDLSFGQKNGPLPEGWGYDCVPSLGLPQFELNQDDELTGTGNSFGIYKSIDLSRFAGSQAKFSAKIKSDNPTTYLSVFTKKDHKSSFHSGNNEWQNLSVDYIIEPDMDFYKLFVWTDGVGTVVMKDFDFMIELKK